VCSQLPRMLAALLLLRLLLQCCNAANMH
jgi:hypothetical protein